MRLSIKNSLILVALLTVGSVQARVLPPAPVPVTSIDNFGTPSEAFTNTITDTIFKRSDLESQSEDEAEEVIYTDVIEENEESEDDKVTDVSEEKETETETAVTTEVPEEEYDEVNIYMEMIKNFDYGDQLTYVIGHKSPDSDTVGSAIAYAELLNKLGIKAKAVISAHLNGESQYYFDHFGLKAPEILTNAEGKQFVLVDHSNYLQAIDGMASARIVGIIDHHNVGDVTSEEPIYARFAPVGAASSIIYRMYNELNIPVSKETAQVMIMSILSDTHNLTKLNTQSIDKKALHDLQKIAGIEDSELELVYKEMTDAKASYVNMNEEEIFKSDYKEYRIQDKFFCMGDMNAKGEAAVKELAEKIYDYIEKALPNSEFSMMFGKIRNLNFTEEDQSEMREYLFGVGENAQEMLKGVFESEEEYEIDGNFIKSRKELSRKTHVIPAITKYINSNSN